MTRQIVQTDRAPAAIGPYSQAVKAGGFLFTAGQIPLDPATMEIVGETAAEQAKQALSSGEISAYYVIPADYLETGELFYVYPDTKPLLSSGQEWVMRRTLLENLVGDAELDEGLAGLERAIEACLSG